MSTEGGEVRITMRDLWKEQREQHQMLTDVSGKLTSLVENQPRIEALAIAAADRAQKAEKTADEAKQTATATADTLRWVGRTIGKVLLSAAVLGILWAVAAQAGQRGTITP